LNGDVQRYAIDITAINWIQYDFTGYSRMWTSSKIASTNYVRSDWDLKTGFGGFGQFDALDTSSRSSSRRSSSGWVHHGSNIVRIETWVQGNDTHDLQ
jgi:hypothetical protein